MEGIAFHYACKQAKIPFLQIRAISNYVTPRNKSEWEIPLAIQNLNQYLIETFK
jgi:futalosine hydrolase